MGEAPDSSLVRDLMAVIDRYVEKTQLDLQTLAEKSGLSLSTIRRLAQGEADRAGADTVINLIDVVLTPQERICFLKRHFPKVGNILEDIYRNQACLESTDIEHGFLKKSLHSFIFNLAATAQGTSVADIERLKGQEGLEALQEMVQRDILIQDRGERIRYKTDGWNTTNADVILDQIRFSTAFFDKSLLGTDAARMAHVTASVNLEAMKKVHALCTKFFYGLLEIQNDESNQGDIPIFVDMLMNVYDPHKLSEN